MNFINKDILVLNIGIGNIQSVVNAINYLGYNCIVGNSKNDIDNAKAIILPGVGAFGEAIDLMKEQDILEHLKESISNRNIYFLGICLGMQLLFEKSFEYGTHKGFGLFKGTVNRMNFSNRLPHVGWNDIEIEKETILFQGIDQKSDFYFDHSFSVICDKELVSSFVEYQGKRVVASVEKDNIFGVQFHPEKSQFIGIELINNFLKKVNNA
ncbi:MAG: imidazole glycerol phosphate synthase subunit HisH [Campylobacteraceae bacterium]|nr:imidazole glycerol phosphate synthase subunit HisH [Campylobacteraceae bacterium]